MRIPFITIDGRHYCWKDILELRRLQRAAYATNAAQLVLFQHLHEDRRPADACTASSRYEQPSLF